jgi:hypothetical protein
MNFVNWFPREQRGSTKFQNEFLYSAVGSDGMDIYELQMN